MTPRKPLEDKPKPSETESAEGPEWWNINPNPVTDWLLPTGKKFKEFFDNTTNGRANLSRMPKIRHHNPEVTSL